MRSLVVCAILAGVLAACGTPPGVLFHTKLVHPDGSTPLPVTLGDTTDLVVRIGPGAFDESADYHPSVRSDPADRNAMILSWTGSACRDSADVSFRRDGDHYLLAVYERGGLFATCPAIALLRAIRIETSEPVSIDQIDMIGSQ